MPINDTYKLIGDYDRHYSSVRSALVTFLLTFSFGLASYLLKEAKDMWAAAIAAWVPYVFLVLAVALSGHFQRLTQACEEIQKDMEEGKYKDGEPNFRSELSERVHQLRLFYYDAPNIALAVIMIVYLIATGAAFIARRCPRQGIDTPCLSAIAEPWDTIVLYSPWVWLAMVVILLIAQVRSTTDSAAEKEHNPHVTAIASVIEQYINQQKDLCPGQAGRAIHLAAQQVSDRLFYK